MITKMGVFKKVFAAGLLAILALPSAIPVANAGITDWFKSKATDVDGQNGNLTAFIGPNLNADITSAKTENSLLVNDNFLMAASNPDKKGKVTVPKSAVSKIVRELYVPITGYSSTIDQTDDSPFITANGTYVYDGVVAANFLPFGTKVKIPDYFGDKIFTVHDRMNKRYWEKIDVWFPDRQSAIQFGVRTLKIQILES
jgi:3D (Asp-Asp-Asp) domain-containing protein